MLSQFLLLAYLNCRDYSITAQPTKPRRNSGVNIDKSAEKKKSRAWQLVPKACHSRPKVVLKSQKYYHIPLVYVATGRYELFEKPKPTTGATSVGPDTLMGEHNETALVVHPIHGRGPSTRKQSDDSLSGYLVEHQDGIASREERKEGEVMVVLHAQMDNQPTSWSALAECDEHEAAHGREYSDEHHGDGIPVAEEGLDSDQLEVAAAFKTYQQLARLYAPTSEAHIRCQFFPENEASLPHYYLAALDSAEDEFEERYNTLESSPLPICDPQGFGCTEDEEGEGLLDPLTLHRAMCAAKEEYCIAEFDPLALVDGTIDPGTYEANSWRTSLKNFMAPFPCISSSSVTPSVVTSPIRSGIPSAVSSARKLSSKTPRTCVAPYYKKTRTATCLWASTR